MSVLAVSALTINRAGLPVVRNVDLQVTSGSIAVLLGANGAGKTTFLEGLSGIIPIAAGRVTVDGLELQKAPSERRSRAGLSHVEQGRSVFRQLTTEENLRVGLRQEDDLAEAYRLFPELEQRRNLRAEFLSGGEQQMLVIARALLGRPKVLLIDEMSAGLAPVVVIRLMDAVRKLAELGLAVILVEQFAVLALSIGDRAYVMRRGQIVYDGECAGLRGSPDELHRLYLGDSTRPDPPGARAASPG